MAWAKYLSPSDYSNVVGKWESEETLFIAGCKSLVRRPNFVFCHPQSGISFVSLDSFIFIFGIASSMRRALYLLSRFTTAATYSSLWCPQASTQTAHL